MTITQLDHLVLTVRDLARTVAFYTYALGMRAVTFGGNRTALAFGDQKINLHEAGHEIAPHAANPTPGSADLCFLTETPLEAVVRHLGAAGVVIELGPVERTGAAGRILSLYLRDPDGNLIEIANSIE
jgi:catechol 2,3-dioxygenase-like lactoylglutathione lyase family enzyme